MSVEPSSKPLNPRAQPFIIEKRSYQQVVAVEVSPRPQYDIPNPPLLQPYVDDHGVFWSNNNNLITNPPQLMSIYVCGSMFWPTISPSPCYGAGGVSVPIMFSEDHKVVKTAKLFEDNDGGCVDSCGGDGKPRFITAIYRKANRVLSSKTTKTMSKVNTRAATTASTTTTNTRRPRKPKTKHVVTYVPSSNMRSFSYIDACRIIPFGYTTVMIKNIPNKIRRETFISFLDSVCAEENHDVKTGNVSSELLAYDFLYLPMDFKTSCNLGYAFVNLTSHVGALRVYDILNMFKWYCHESKKTCEIGCAKIQGLEALKRHFQNCVFNCSDDSFLPVAFSPPRDGSAFLTARESVSLVGRLGRSPSAPHC
ncbi:Mei2-like, C-terminal RNA recognition motif [Dillenia turbinata]|uniref:Mei2-like, C-terminal RNA recognition motif n=1 Tax=Dillenia turbinata TaxID=194707 RepID=A0AAN8ZMW4_9MAGN